MAFSLFLISIFAILQKIINCQRPQDQENQQYYLKKTGNIIQIIVLDTVRIALNNITKSAKLKKIVLILQKNV